MLDSAERSQRVLTNTQVKKYSARTKFAIFIQESMVGHKAHDSENGKSNKTVINYKTVFVKPTTTKKREILNARAL